MPGARRPHVLQTSLPLRRALLPRRLIREGGTDSWQLFEVGARYESGSGLVYGIDLPLLVINDVLGLDNDPSDTDTFFAPPTALAFLQLYVGYSWPL